MIPLIRICGWCSRLLKTGTNTAIGRPLSQDEQHALGDKMGKRITHGMCDTCMQEQMAATKKPFSGGYGGFGGYGEYVAKRDLAENDAFDRLRNLAVNTDADDNDAKPGYTPAPSKVRLQTLSQNAPASAKHAGFIEPDALNVSTGIPFFFGDQKMYYGNQGSVHISILPNIQKDNLNVRNMLQGRVGDYSGTKHVSFWNSDNDVYDHLLTACLAKLQQDNLIDNNTVVSTPLIGSVPLPQVQGAKAKKLSREEEERVRLAQQMHTMTGQAKRDAMKKLGVGGGGKPHAMQTQMQKAGLLGPGQKWWARTSESRR